MQVFECGHPSVHRSRAPSGAFASESTLGCAKDETSVGRDCAYQQIKSKSWHPFCRTIGLSVYADPRTKECA